MMYRAFLCVVLLTFSSGAPYGGFSSSRTFPVRQEQQVIQKPVPVVRVAQADQTDVVDTLGAGYSFFKKQPISSRPLIQQKSVANEQSSMSSFTDTADQWSGYAQSSAFKQQPVVTQMRSSAPAAYGSQQDSFNLRSIMPKTFINQQQTQIDSSFNQLQQQPLELIPQRTVDLDNSYRRQQQTEKTVLRVNSNDGYGQQVQPVFNNLINAGDFSQQVQQVVQQPEVRTIVDSGYGQQHIQQDQPVIRVTTCNIVSQPSQPTVNSLVNQGEFNQQIQEQFPSVTRTLDNGYGQQQQVEKSVMTFQSNDAYGQQQQLQPAFDDLVSSGGYGQQVQQKVVLQPTIKAVDSGYGQQQQVAKSVMTFQSNDAYGQQQKLQPAFNDLVSSGGYGQQVQQKVVLQPTIKAVDNGYGQQKHFEKTVLRVKSADNYGQVQPTFNNLINEGDFRQQIQQVVQPAVQTMDAGYGQQQQQQIQQDQPLVTITTCNVVSQPAQPTVNTLINEGELSQQVQQVVPTEVRTVDSGYGQQQHMQEDHSQWTIQSNDAFAQQAQPTFSNLINEGDFSQQVQQIVQQPVIRTVESSYGQQVQQPLIRTVESGYGQQVQQPLVRTVESGYGQQVQQPLIRTVESSYGQQVQQPLIRTVESGYGQQVQQPLIRTVESGYGQQVQQPLIRTVESGYGQQVQQPLIRTVESGYGQQVQQKVILPKVQKLVADYQQHQADISALPMIQPAVSAHHTDFVRSNSALMSSAHVAPKSQSFGAGGYGRR